VFVGWPDCRALISTDDRIAYSFGQPPSNELPGKVVLAAGELQRRDRFIAFTVHIRNGSDELIPAISAAPIGVSWRFMADDAKAVPADPGWTTRETLVADIAPGAEQSLVITDALPPGPGSYRLEVTLLAKGRYWFHDRGMRILTFPDPVIVP
jgi:hypothetical protein